MAFGKKTGGRNFLPGNKASKGKGRPKLTEEEKLKKAALQERLKEYLESGEANEDFERLRTRRPGDALNMALDRVDGKPKQAVSLSGPDGGPVQIEYNIENLTDDERDHLAGLLAKARKGSS